MIEWNAGKGEMWVKTALWSGGEVAFRVSDVKYASSNGDGCTLTMNDGRLFVVKMSVEDFYNLL